jgi:OmpA-OmpF porin, OOP family
MTRLSTRGAVTAFLLASAWAAPVHAGEVRMFDRPPTVSEVQELLAAPAPARRYRSIEIIGEAGQSAQNDAPAPTTPASFELNERRQVMPAPILAPVPIEEAAATPSVQFAAAQPEAREDLPDTSADQGAFGFRINFRFDSAVIPADYFEYLDNVATALHSAPDVSIVVEGHTDATGGEAYNMTLSGRRAKAVETYLVQKHRIAVSRIQAVGRGEGEPLSDNPFDQANRRVQFARTN